MAQSHHRRTAFILALALSQAVLTACGSGGASSPDTTPQATTHSISGAVTGAVISGVTITLSGVQSGTASTSATGAYSFSGLPNGSYVLLPSKLGFTFTPMTLPVTLDGSDVSGRNFTATADKTYAIFGSLIVAPIREGVTITIGGPVSASTTTDAAGNFTFTGLLPGEYTLTATRAGLRFTQGSVTITLLEHDLTGSWFIAGCAQGDACPSTNPCRAGAFACTSGLPVCTESGPITPDGTSCGTDRVCGGGTCTPCTAGQACTPTSACHTGTIACGSGAPVCVDSGVNASDGTLCGELGTCSAGGCVTAAEGFEYTGEMVVPMIAHTATVLPGGSILFMEGARAETFDPVVGLSKSTVPPIANRRLHTATLLPNGKVLVAGGFGGPPGGVEVSLASAELFDPATRSFTATGAMSDGRYWHTATLLSNGKVLVAGGRAQSAQGTLAFLDSAEIYDPDTGLFTPTGSMMPGGIGAKREGHSATLLPNGKVLVAGGASVYSGGPPPGFGFLMRAQLYDPSTGAFTPTGFLSSERNFHTATLLPSGKVLVAGGQAQSAQGFFLIYLDSAELYDPGTGTFTVTGAMAEGRTSHSATLLPSGEVLVVGGASIETLASAELYDPATGAFRPTGSLHLPRQDHTATILGDGRVLVAGGTIVQGPKICGSQRRMEAWAPAPTRLQVASPSKYVCHQGFSATLGVTNGSSLPLTVQSVQLITSIPGCGGTVPSSRVFTPTVSSVAPGQSSTIITFGAAGAYCCAAPGCTSRDYYRQAFEFRVSTSAGTMRRSVLAEIDLIGCSEVCP
jgi:hypothetical protein